MTKKFKKTKHWDLFFASAYAFAYDEKVCSGEICKTDRYDGTCRDNVFVNLRIDTSDVQPVDVIRHVLNRSMSESEIRDSGLLAHVEGHVDLTCPDNYLLTVDRGYYGAEVYSSLNPETKSVLMGAMYSWGGWEV